MNQPGLKRTIVIISASLGILTFLIIFLTDVILVSGIWKAAVIGGITVFLAGYLITFWYLRKIIIQRINPLYKIVRPQAGTDLSAIDEFDDQDLIEVAENDVSKWIRQNTREIDKLKQLEKYRREFLGNVSHELKTPIFNIQGYVSTLLDGGLEDETVNRKYLERAEKSINRLISIVEDLEKISKLESGKLDLVREDFNIFLLIREVCDMHEMRAVQKNIKLLAIQPVLPFFVNADKARIADVLNNLIVNSVIYGKQDGTTTVQLFDIDDRVLIEVADNGIGIEEKYLPRLFERFFRVDKSRSSEQGGTGLGLAIVKHILEVHNQPVFVKSQPGEGTSFTFTLDKATNTK